MTALEQDHAKIVAVLDAARRGGSDIRALVGARELAERHNLGLVTAEINEHIRTRAPGGTFGGQKIALSIAIGILCGLFTQAILFSTKRR